MKNIISPRFLTHASIAFRQIVLVVGAFVAITSFVQARDWKGIVAYFQQEQGLAALLAAGAIGSAIYSQLKGSARKRVEELADRLGEIVDAIAGAGATDAVKANVATPGEVIATVKTPTPISPTTLYDPAPTTHRIVPLFDVDEAADAAGEGMGVAGEIKPGAGQ